MHVAIGVMLSIGTSATKDLVVKTMFRTAIKILKSIALAMPSKVKRLKYIFNYENRYFLRRRLEEDSLYALYVRMPVYPIGIIHCTLVH